MKVIGLDISRGKATACAVEAIPVDLLEYARSYKAQTFKANRSDLEQLAELGTVFALEPTGSDHRIFVEYLRSRGKTVLGCTGSRVRNFARDSGILNKADREDAAVIACFTLRHLQANNQKAFVSIEAFEVREKYAAIQGLVKQRVQLINQVRSRLVYECPELHNAQSSVRSWLGARPPQIWRAIAGEEELFANGTQVPEDSIGRGLSELTRQLAAQICSIERLQYALECECDKLLNSDLFTLYRSVLNQWRIADLTQVAILATIYPIDQFLEDGKRVRKRVFATERSQHTKTMRDRSLKQFKRALGAGRMWIQSGKKEFWAKTGNPQTRKALFAYLDMIVVVRRQPSLKRLKNLYPDLAIQLQPLSQRKARALIKNSYTFRAVLEPFTIGSKEVWKDEHAIAKVIEFNGSSKQIAALQLFYEFAPQCQGRSKKERLMAKVYPRFVTWLFRDLIKAHRDSGDNTEL